MAFRRSAAVFSVMLVSLLAAFTFYDQPFVDGQTDQAKETQVPRAKSLSDNRSPAAKVIEPQVLTEMVEGGLELPQADDLFYNTLPLSLNGTPRPTAVGVNEDDELIADHRVRNLFEYYLTAIGEEPLE